MKYLKIAITCLISSLLLISCNKPDKKEVKEIIDTASHSLGRELDTLINTTLYNDSVYNNAPIEKIDLTTLANENFRDNLNDIFKEYSDIKNDLADDDSLDIIKQALDLRQALLKAQTENASEKSQTKWYWVLSRNNYR
jgi:hypothetical protein